MFSFVSSQNFHAYRQGVALGGCVSSHPKACEYHVKPSISLGGVLWFIISDRKSPKKTGWFDESSQKVGLEVGNSSPNSGWNFQPSCGIFSGHSFIAGIYRTRHFFKGSAPRRLVQMQKKLFLNVRKGARSSGGFWYWGMVPGQEVPFIIFASWFGNGGYFCWEKTQEMVPRFCWWQYLWVSGFW